MRLLFRFNRHPNCKVEVASSNLVSRSFLQQVVISIHLFYCKIIPIALGAVAELKRNPRNLIKERVRMGIDRARMQGKQFGRTRV
jgi:DNA invertase Pin-like site-specific DNA recombinase